MELLFDLLDVLIWLDNILGYADKPESVSTFLENVLPICATKGRNLKIKKCEILAIGM